MTVIVVEDGNPSSYSFTKQYRAFTVPLVRDFVANGDTPEKAVERLKLIIKSYTYGNHSRLHSIVSIPLNELIVDDVMNS